MSVDTIDKVDTVPAPPKQQTPEEREKMLEALKQQATQNGKPPALTYQPAPLEMVSGWEFGQWKQRHIMPLVDSGVLDPEREWPNAHRGNFEIVKAAMEAGCFSLPTAVTEDMILDLDSRDVNKLARAVVQNYLNLTRTPKN